MSDTPQVLLAHHLKALRLPTFLREYDKLARQCAAEGVDHSALPAAPGRAGDSRTGTADRRTPDQGGQLPGGQESRRLRLRGHLFAQSDPGCWSWHARSTLLAART